jgi:hypothetical protein
MKLKNEATAEEEQHGWCQTELAANKQTRDAKTKDSNELTAEIEGLNSNIDFYVGDSHRRDRGS